MNKYLICKKDFIRINSRKVIFKKNQRYKYIDIKENQTAILKGCIFVYYDEFNDNDFLKGYRFYKNEQHKISDFFYDQIEIRKQKLIKITEHDEDRLS